MSDVIGRGVIEVVADATKLKAGIEESKRSIRGLGSAAAEAGTRSSKSIDAYVKRLETQRATMNMSTREAELYKLSLRGATAEQLKAADAVLKLNEAQEKGAAIGDAVKTGLIAAAAAAGTVAVALGAMVISSINAADNLNDLSKKTGVSVENLSGLAYAAEQSGTDLDGVAASISKLSDNIGKNGEKFRALGITSKDPLEAFQQLADVMSQIDDEQTRAAVASTALGKSWQSSAPLLAEGGKRIGELIEKGRKFSGVTQEMADDADEFNDALADMKAVANGLGNDLAREVLPGMNEVLKAIRQAYTDSGKLQAAWVALGSVGAFLFTNEFASAEVKIKDLSKELKQFEQDLDLSKNAPSVGYIGRLIFGETTEALEKKVAETKRLIAGLEDELKPKPKVAPVRSKEEIAREEKEKKEAADRAAKFINDQAKDQKRQADALAKEQLSSDLQNIRAAVEAEQNILSNSERLLEARRSAGLIGDGEYFAAKAAFIELNGDAQERALTDEIARLEQEKSIGAERISNLRAIAEAEARLASVRANRGANSELAGVQEAAAAAKIRIDLSTKQIEAETKAAEQAAVNAEQIKFSLLNQIDAENESYGQRLSDLVAFRDAKLENEEEGNRLIEAETERHNQWMMDMQAQNNLSTISMASSLADQMYQILERAGKERTALGKAMFLAQKALAVAEIIVNTERGASAALGFGPFGIPMATLIRAMGYASAGIVAGQAIAQVSGGRALGGPVSGGKMYQVNENGPEMLSSGGKDFLMMGKNGGVVIPTNRMSSQGSAASSTGSAAMKLTIINNTTGKIDRVTEVQVSPDERALIISEARNAVAADLNDPNSRTSRAMKNNFQTQRNR